MDRSEATQLAAAAAPPPHLPYDLGPTDYSELTEEEKTTLAGLEGRMAERATEENIIREGAESALKSLRSMVQVMFGLTLGSIASKDVPSWVVALGTIMSMTCFAGAIVAAIWIARGRLLSLRWRVLLLRVKNAELHADATSFVEGLKSRKVYLTDFFLKEEPSIRVGSIIALSSPNQDLIQCYRATLWFYGATGLAVLIAGIMGVLVALKKG